MAVDTHDHDPDYVIPQVQPDALQAQETAELGADQPAGIDPAPQATPEPPPPETLKTPPITGYRDLRSEDVHHVNAFKEQEKKALELVDQALRETDKPERCRQLALARTNIQQGFMWACRSIMAPEWQ